MSKSITKGRTGSTQNQFKIEQQTGEQAVDCQRWASKLSRYVPINRHQSLNVKYNKNRYMTTLANPCACRKGFPPLTGQNPFCQFLAKIPCEFLRYSGKFRENGNTAPQGVTFAMYLFYLGFLAETKGFSLSFECTPYFVDNKGFTTKR